VNSTLLNHDRRLSRHDGTGPHSGITTMLETGLSSRLRNRPTCGFGLTVRDHTRDSHTPESALPKPQP
jgi:hypothetical protein